MPTTPPSKLILLGAGTPNAEPQRAGSSVALVVKDEAYLFDCGAGVMQRANTAFQLGIQALEPRRLLKSSCITSFCGGNQKIVYC